MTRIADSTETIGIDANDYDHDELLTTVSTNRLKAALSIMEKLDETRCDLRIADSRESSSKAPLLRITPPGEPELSVSVAPVFESDRDPAEYPDLFEVEE
jgi:hypothetical protein